MLEDKIEQTNEWWKEKKFTNELDRRFNAIENGTDKGGTVEELDQSITKLRMKKYGK